MSPLLQSLRAALRAAFAAARMRPAASPRIAARLIHGCAVLGLALGAAGVLLVGPVPPDAAFAQTRNFPAGTRIGVLRMGVFPEATIDDKPVLFAPGARIHDLGNALVLPATLTEAVAIRYIVDPMGQIGRAWLLSDEEIEAARRQRSNR